MKLVTFNPLRTIGIPNISYIKPMNMYKEIEKIKCADMLLFPEYWQVNSLVYGLKKKIFPSIESYHLGHNKVEMTRVLKTICPEQIPYTEIVSNTEENKKMVMETFPLPFVAKEIKNSMGQGVFLIHNEKDFQDYTEKVDVLYIQEYIPNDRDLRICVIGNEVVAAYWRVEETGGFHHNVAQGGKVSYDNIPVETLDLVLDVSQKLGIDHAGFDVIFNNGKPYILEFNILFGNQGIQKQKVSLEQKIVDYISKES
ncbi:ATP-grasp domain-containing protein [Chengkuizengella axinellae]|uniref:ATP-grasp domain-containing protein n=1 Tax=Chengkuizengella axinellae TaxID=3064388 RepID=A0ABT9IV98_9BACL|nr:ATP-grasp domain-containing protein [Chengkuizengella sp. 2205SS18-9]MDP5273275.1 ATP-grasp domain-containing protein [Chengkuizengella sp. 2205SS18-9]